MLRVSEIFYSIQGESTLVGLPTLFIRLTGCPLRCQYCDTSYAFSGGKKYTIDEILAEAANYSPRYVTLTGGEPLAQADCLSLLSKLCEHYTVSLETSGAMDIRNVDARVIKVMDLKTPDSLEEKKNNYENLALLTERDQLKFVICSKADYDWSKKIITDHDLIQRCQVLFSPSHTQLSPEDLAEWILSDNLPVRLQLQIHKYIWGNKPGH